MAGRDSFGRIQHDCLDENLVTWFNKHVNPMCTDRFNMELVVRVEELRRVVRSIEGSACYDNGDRILGSVSRTALTSYLNMPDKTFPDRLHKRQLLEYILSADKNNIDPITGEDLGSTGVTTHKVKEWRAAILNKPYERYREFKLTESDAKIMRSALILWGSESGNGTGKRVNKLLRRLDGF